MSEKDNEIVENVSGLGRINVKLRRKSDAYIEGHVSNPAVFSAYIQSLRTTVAGPDKSHKVVALPKTPDNKT